MAMYIYNSLTRKKEKFEPLKEDRVSMYICGVTPYDEPHLGHAVTALRGCIVRRFLQRAGYKVTYVQNITDVDDKIINKSRLEGVSFREISRRYTESYTRQMNSFGLEAPDFEPKVTEYIEKIVAFIQQLIEKGRAYTTPNGDVYYDVSKEPTYGCLSNQIQSEVLTGTRKEVRDEKRNSHDFALWKRFSEDHESFPSPWGQGRPGWHIECSVMCTDILGPVTDIHLGGLDLIFPHHENELAQCSAYFNQPFVKYWAHLGLLNIDGTKMSKSLGNFLTVDQALHRYGRSLLTYTILTFHYRSPINLSDDLFEEHINIVLEWYRLLSSVERPAHGENTAEPTVLSKSFDKAMQDDFNTPQALVVLGQGFKDLRKLLISGGDVQKISALAAELRSLGKVMYLFSDDYIAVLDQALAFRSARISKPRLSVDELNELYDQRQKAREEKDYAKADKVRDLLLPYSITILDQSQQRFRF